MPATEATRGRPKKYGRPARMVALTLPEDVLQWLSTIHKDPAWAIVTLCERATRRRKPTSSDAEAAAAELVQLPNRRALIVVNPESFRNLPGVSTVPLADGRAFLVLTNGGGIADLELAISDRIDDERLSASHREELQRLHAIVRGWRRDANLKFYSRSIIVVDRSPREGPAKVLTGLKTVRPQGRREPSRARR